MFLHADECVRHVSAQRGLGPSGEFSVNAKTIAEKTL